MFNSDSDHRSLLFIFREFDPLFPGVSSPKQTKHHRNRRRKTESGLVVVGGSCGAGGMSASFSPSGLHFPIFFSLVDSLLGSDDFQAAEFL